MLSMTVNSIAIQHRIVATDDLYLFGILNSELMIFVLSIASTKQGGYFEYKPMYLEQFPSL